MVFRKGFWAKDLKDKKRRGSVFSPVFHHGNGFLSDGFQMDKGYQMCL